MTSLLLAFPLGLLSLFSIYLGFGRNARFLFHDYNGNHLERLRDNVLSCLNTSLSLAVWPLIFIATDTFLQLLLYFLLLAVIFMGIAGNYLSSVFLISLRVITRENNFGPLVNWYEFIPIAFIVGWAGFLLTNILILFFSKTSFSLEKINTINPTIGLFGGILASSIVIWAVYQKYKIPKAIP
jgi:hypothetical protein